MAQCLPIQPCLGALHKLFPSAQSAGDNVPLLDQVTHNMTQEFLSDSKTTEATQTAVGNLLQEALVNGTLEKALSTPAKIKGAPLPSCPYLSARSIATEVKRLLDDGLVSGSLNLEQAEELKNLIATYNFMKSDSVTQTRALLVSALENGFLEQALKEERQEHEQKKSGLLTSEPPTETLFPVISKLCQADKATEASVAKVLEEALINGTFEKALSVPVRDLQLPLPSCPGMSRDVIKREIKSLLEDAVASGGLSLDQARQLRDKVTLYNRVQSLLSGEDLVIIDYSKLYHYKPPARAPVVSTDQASAAKAKAMDLPLSSSEFEDELQRQEREADRA